MGDELGRILLIGATGAVGEAVLAQADRPISYLARRAAKHAGSHRPLLVPPDQWADEIARFKPDILMSALGTTMRQAGSQQAFRAVDYELQIAAAQAAKAAGAKHFIGVSSVGASARSSNFYLRTKGEVEQAIGALAFDRIDILQPGLLRGGQRPKWRPSESLAAMAAPVMDALLIGSWKKYRSVTVLCVASAMWRLACEKGPGRFSYESDAIIALAD